LVATFVQAERVERRATDGIPCIGPAAHSWGLPSSQVWLRERLGDAKLRICAPVPHQLAPATSSGKFSSFVRRAGPMNAPGLENSGPAV